jgi:hypothetical protein
MYVSLFKCMKIAAAYRNRLELAVATQAPLNLYHFYTFGTLYLGCSISGL